MEPSLRGKYMVEVGDHLGRVLKGPNESGEGYSQQGKQHEQRLRTLLGNVSPCVLGGG